MIVPLNTSNFARWLKQTSPTEVVSDVDRVIKRYASFLGAEGFSKPDVTRARWVYVQYKQGSLK